MKTSPVLLLKRGGLAAIMAIACGFTLPLLKAQSFNPIVTKLHGRPATPATPQADNQFGVAVAVSERWVAVGEIHNDDKASNAGAVHVFDAAKSSYVSKLTASDGNVGDLFGISVAVCGNLVRRVA